MLHVSDDGHVNNTHVCRFYTAVALPSYGKSIVQENIFADFKVNNLSRYNVCRNINKGDRGYSHNFVISFVHNSGQNVVMPVVMLLAIFPGVPFFVFINLNNMIVTVFFHSPDCRRYRIKQDHKEMIWLSAFAGHYCFSNLLYRNHC